MSAMSRQSRQRTLSPSSRLKSASSVGISGGGEKTAHFDLNASMTSGSKAFNAQTRPSTAVTDRSG